MTENSMSESNYQQVGPLIGPEVQFPTPWRVAEKSGDHHVIVCSEGHYTGEIPNEDLAELIVNLVNEYAKNSGFVKVVGDWIPSDAVKHLTVELQEAYRAGDKKRQYDAYGEAQRILGTWGGAR